jgi:hypothetical protein
MNIHSAPGKGTLIDEFVFQSLEVGALGYLQALPNVAHSVGVDLAVV